MWGGTQTGCILCLHEYGKGTSREEGVGQGGWESKESELWIRLKLLRTVYSVKKERNEEIVSYLLKC